MKLFRTKANYFLKLTYLTRQSRISLSTVTLLNIVSSTRNRWCRTYISDFEVTKTANNIVLQFVLTDNNMQINMQVTG